MNGWDEFGEYLLLKKLAEDPLGETFRAAKMGTQAIERVVLLRIFNGQGIDSDRLWQKASQRAPLQRALDSPNIGTGVDMGRVRGIPYVAYDYVSGKTLVELWKRAKGEGTSITVDNALLVAERVALALALAYEIRLENERVLHGFLVPHLVTISNEGESRLLGFEVGPALQDFAGSGPLSQEFARYLSPEALAGGPLDRSDDVYSLGAILFELLTGERLPAPTAGGYGALIDRAVLPAEGTPLPPPLANLLKRSLAPRAERIPEAVSWHKAISRMMIEGQYNPTTFNLAFFMHNLFREEIERETQELQAEKKIEAPAAKGTEAAAPAVDEAATRPLREIAPVREDTLTVRERYGIEEEARKSKKGLFIGLAALLLMAAVGTGLYFYLGGQLSEPEPAAAVPEPAEAALPPPEEMPGEPEAEPAPPVPEGPTPEELEAQIAEILAKQSRELEARLRAQYDESLQNLQRQLDEAKKAAADAAEREAERIAPLEQQKKTEPEVQRPERGEETVATRQPETTPARPPAVPPATTTPTQPETTQAPSAPESQAQPRETQPTATTTPPSRPSTGSQPATPTQPTQEPVKPGSLVTLGPGVTPPELIRMPEPRYPPPAKRLKKEATVTVRVLVDENGRAAEAEVLGKKAGFGFDEAALEAVRAATFKPATKDGVKVKMWHMVNVRFTL